MHAPKLAQGVGWDGSEAQKELRAWQETVVGALAECAVAATYYHTCLPQMLVHVCVTRYSARVMLLWGTSEHHNQQHPCRHLLSAFLPSNHFNSDINSNPCQWESLSATNVVRGSPCQQ